MISARYPKRNDAYRREARKMIDSAQTEMAQGKGIALEQISEAVISS